MVITEVLECVNGGSSLFIEPYTFFKENELVKPVEFTSLL